MIVTNLSEPTGASSLVQAVLWIQQTMLGTVATIIATISVATIGFMMLRGRVSIRHGALVVLGCFVVFGAPTIAAGLYTLAAYDAGSMPNMVANERNTVPWIPPPPAQPEVYDPYAGASVPVR